jgi:hypothetical protein
VAIVRNAPAIVASYRRQGKSFDFRNLLAQPELMRDWLEPLRDDMEAAVAGPDDPIARVSLLWRAIYHVVAELRDRNLDGFTVVRHEDLSLDPVGGFERIYSSLGLPFDDRARRTVEWGSLSPSGTRNAERPHVWTLRGGLSKTAFRPLDSRENLVRWRRYLSDDEAARVRSLTGDVESRFYRGDEEWW